MTEQNIPLWEVFIRSRNGLAHKHVGSLHASDATMALQNARDLYTRRGEGLSIWVAPSSAITASDPELATARRQRNDIAGTERITGRQLRQGLSGILHIQARHTAANGM